MIIEKITSVCLQEVDNLGGTERGGGHFGSTGKY